METNTHNIGDDNINFFGGDDFVFTKNKEGEFVGGGYKIDSFFLNEGMPVMTTYNSGEQIGSGCKVSSPFENLAVPAGLFYINTKVQKKDFNINHDEQLNGHKMAPDEMMDKLFALIENDKKRKRKTKKNNLKQNMTKQNKTNTRKNR
jgi:hypothetical protein